MRVKDEIEKSGFFWTPSMSDQKIPGVLRISEGGEINLEVVGLFDESISGLNAALNGRAELGRIVGHIEKYGYVTLDDCFYTNPSISFGGISKSSVRVNTALLGVAFDEGEIVKFNEFSFSVEGIDEWVGISGIQIDHDIQSRSASITYTPPKEITVSLDNGMKLLITFHWTIPGSGTATTEAKITQKVFFKLASDSEAPLESFISKAYEITTLMCFAIDRTVCIERVIASAQSIARDVGEGKVVPAQIDVYYSSLPYVRKAQKVDYHRMLFRYRQIEKDAGKIVNRWISAYETIDPALDLYFSVRAGNHKYLESRFLALAQGLETLHRRTSTETMMDPQVYGDLMSQLVASCPQEQREWLSMRLAYGNEPGLSRRLKTIIEPFKKYFGTSKLRQRLIKSIVDTRNYLTHYDESNKSAVVGGTDLYPLCEKLEAIFQLHLLKILGFTDEEIDAVYRGSHDLRHKLGNTKVSSVVTKLG